MREFNAEMDKTMGVWNYRWGDACIRFVQVGRSLRTYIYNITSSSVVQSGLLLILLLLGGS